MQRSIQNKSVVIYDSGTFLGVHIAVNLLQKDYKVYLFLTAEPDENSSSQNLKNIYKGVEIFSVPSGCVDNYIEKIFSFQPQKIFITPPKVRLDMLFPASVSRENLPKLEAEEAILSLQKHASKQDIDVIPPIGYLCDEENLSEIIDKILAFLQSTDRNLWLNTLDISILLATDILQESSGEVDMKFDLDKLYTISLRHVLKIILEIIGAELEFSGKDIHERGVIVDYENHLLLNSEHIRLGNTVIKINDKIYPQICQFSLTSDKPSNQEVFEEQLIVLIKKLIYEKIQGEL